MVTCHPESAASRWFTPPVCGHASWPSYAKRKTRVSRIWSLRPLRTHRHVVQFYDRDEELAESAGDYLADAIAEGGAAVIVATPARWANFEPRLATRGVDIAAARRKGSCSASTPPGWRGS